MGVGLGLVRLNPGNFRFQSFDTLIELAERQRVKIFPAEIDNRLAGLKIVIFVHERQR